MSIAEHFTFTENDLRREYVEKEIDREFTPEKQGPPDQLAPPEVDTVFSWLNTVLTDVDETEGAQEPSLMERLKIADRELTADYPDASAFELATARTYGRTVLFLALRQIPNQ